MALSAYLLQTSRLLHDPANVNYSVGDLTAYINLARSQISAGAQCVRFLNTVNTVTNQEIYSLPNPNTSGIGQAFGLISIAATWGTYKPVLTRYSWSDFQAFMRVFTGTVFGFPESYGCQGAGSNQTIYMFPIPSQVLTTEWDCLHAVLPLASDTDPEALPYPFTDAVPYYAAYFALMNAQRFQESNIMKSLYKEIMNTARSGSNPLFTATPYPRTPGDATS